MTIGEIIKKRIHEFGGNGLANTISSCGCGDKHNWFPCDCPNTEECKPAIWKYCHDCELSGQCEYHDSACFETKDAEGCYLPLELEEE